jgi:signal transduction histidine kinase
MKERANHIGASLKIESKVGEGTEIIVNWQDNTGEVLK